MSSVLGTTSRRTPFQRHDTGFDFPAPRPKHLREAGFLRFEVQALGQVGLGVEVHKQDALTHLRQCVAKVQGCGGLADAARVVGYADDHPLAVPDQDYTHAIEGFSTNQVQLRCGGSQ